MIKNVETTKYGAGHVLLEVYLNDLKKWALLDGQWDAVPMINNIPLNAVEFQKAIVENYEGLDIRSSSAFQNDIILIGFLHTSTILLFPLTIGKKLIQK